jgi:hypothetical protein
LQAWACQAPPPPPPLPPCGTARVLACTAAAAWPRAASAVPSCAGAYVSGAAGSNACTAGSVRIETEAACRTAAAAAGKTPHQAFVETDSTYPRGCYYNPSTNSAFFNTDAVGAGSSQHQLLCAAVTTGAPLAPLRARGHRREQRQDSCLKRRKVAHRVLTLYYAPCCVPGTLRRARAATRVGRGRHCPGWFKPLGRGSIRQYAAAHGTAGQSI